MPILLAYRGGPPLLVPGAAVFQNLPDAQAAALILFGVVPVPLSLLSGPVPTHPTRILLDGRDYTELDAVTAFSYPLTVKQKALALAANVRQNTLTFGEFAADNSYSIVCTPSNPGGSVGAVTGAIGTSYDYEAVILLDRQNDAPGPNPATEPDTTPGPQAPPTAADIAAGSPGLWQWRVLSFEAIAAGAGWGAWSAAGASSFAVGRFGKSEPFTVQAQDIGDETPGLWYHGPNQAAPDALPPPTVRPHLAENPATKSIQLFVSVEKPQGETWQADGGRLLRVVYGGEGHTSDGNYFTEAARTPGAWSGPRDEITGLLLPGPPDANRASGFVTNFGDVVQRGPLLQVPVFCGVAWAVYGLGEPTVHIEPGGVDSPPGTIFTRIFWPDTATVQAVSDCSPGAMPTRLEPPPAPGPAPAMAALYPCIGPANSSGFDAARREYYITGERNRLRLGVDFRGPLPSASVGIVTDDAGTGLGAVLEALTGTPCVQLGIGLGISRTPGRIGISAGPFLELGTGGPNPYRIGL